jgi:hypothetical protein
MKVTAEVKIEKLEQVINVLAAFREHRASCEIEMTEFCTCGLRNTMRMVEAAINLEVEVPSQKRTESTIANRIRFLLF